MAYQMGNPVAKVKTPKYQDEAPEDEIGVEERQRKPNAPDQTDYILDAMGQSETKSPKPYNEGAQGYAQSVEAPEAPEPAPAPGSGVLGNTPMTAAQSQPAGASKPSGGVGHDGVFNGLNREQWRDKWMSSGVTNMEGLRQWSEENGGEVLSDNGTVRTPFGEELDILANARTGKGTAAWTQVGGAGDGPATPSLGPESAPMKGLQTTGANLGTAGGNMGAPSADDAIAQMIAGTGGMSAKNLQNDPAVAAQRYASSREFDQIRAQAAEENAQGGVAGSGGSEGRMRQLDESEALGNASFAGQRAGEAQRQRFSELMGGSQLSQNDAHFMKGLAQDRDKFLQSMGLSWAQLSQQERLAIQQMQQQARQFDANLDFNYDNLEADQNYRATLAAL